MSNKVILVVHPYLSGGRNPLGSGGLWDTDLPLSYIDHFREITRGCDLLMDRAVWFSLPVRPLPARGTHYVVTKLEPVSKAHNVSSVEEGIIRYRESRNTQPLCVIGGEWVFRKALPFADELSVTKWRDRRPNREEVVQVDLALFSSLEDKPGEYTQTTHYFRK